MVSRMFRSKNEDKSVDMYANHFIAKLVYTAGISFLLSPMTLKSLQKERKKNKSRKIEMLIPLKFPYFCFSHSNSYKNVCLKKIARANEKIRFTWKCMLITWTLKLFVISDRWLIPYLRALMNRIVLIASMFMFEDEKRSPVR